MSTTHSITQHVFLPHCRCHRSEQRHRSGYWSVLTKETPCPPWRTNKPQVRQLALQYPKSAFNNGLLLVYLTARDKKRGEEALKNIRNDDQLKHASALQEHGGPTEVRYHQLDISQTNSIRVFSDFLKKQHPEGIDIVINNAGIAMDGFSQSSPYLTHLYNLRSRLTNHFPSQTPMSSKKPSNATTTVPSKPLRPSSPSSSPAAAS